MKHTSKHFFCPFTRSFPFLISLTFNCFAFFIFPVPPSSNFLTCFRKTNGIQLTKSVFSYVILSLRYAEYTGGPDAALVFVSLHLDCQFLSYGCLSASELLSSGIPNGGGGG